MTERQKKAISEMRKAGYGYKAIAQKLGISVNTIKSHCKRNGLGASIVKNEKTSFMPDFHYCRQCGALVEQPAKRKEKKFCSDYCRNKWWNEHQILVKKEAYYEITCQGCGQKFNVYGNKKRKYCSHECYIKHRFGNSKVETLPDINRSSDLLVTKEAEVKQSQYTKEEWNNRLNFMMSMHIARKMYNENLITRDEYRKIREVMMNKYHSEVAYFLYENPDE